MRPLLFLCLTLMSAITFAGDSHVSASIIANRTTIAKGETFQVGIVLKMSDHWHTYWEFPGFSGLPTSWEVKEVPGLKIEDLQFPIAKKFTDDAGYVTYGYDDQTMLHANAVYTGDAAEITLEGTVKWLECKELCIPGDEDVKLTLKVGQSEEINADTFAKYQALTPAPPGEDAPFDMDIAYKFEAEKWYGTLKLIPTGGVWSDKVEDFRFLPLGSEYAELSAYNLTIEDGQYIFKLEYDAFETEVPNDLVLKGVVQAQIDDAAKVYRLPLFSKAQLDGLTNQAQDAAEEVIPTTAAPTTIEGGTDYAFWYILMFAFIGGAILNLMPCVLPVLSLKVFSLISEAGESTMRRIQFGWVYTLGIMISFLILSLFFVSAKAAGQQLGVGFQFQSPAFVLAIAALIFIMALSFLGVFYFGAPNADKLQNLSQKSGVQGAFFQGALMTILSTPCTAPFLGAAYGWALTQSAAIIMIVFQMVAFGLAFPYLLLCYFPALLKFLPKPGAWMNHFKVSMGFLLMGTVIWLIHILNDLTGSAGVLGAMVLMLFLSAATWVYGMTWHSSARLKGVLVGVLLIGSGVYGGLFKLWDIREPFAAKQEKMEELRLTFLSEAGGDSTDLYAELDKMVTTAEKIQWVPYTEGNLDYYRKQDRMVFLDFTATWCATCKANEKLVINTKGVRELFEAENVVTMKADYTDKDDHLTEIIKSFQRAGVPLYVVYPGMGEPLLLPETITKGIVTEAVEKARGVMQTSASLETKSRMAGN